MKQFLERARDGLLPPRHQGAAIHALPRCRGVQPSPLGLGHEDPSLLRDVSNVARNGAVAAALRYAP